MIKKPLDLLTSWRGQHAHNLIRGVGGRDRIPKGLITPMVILHSLYTFTKVKALQKSMATKHEKKWNVLTIYSSPSKPHSYICLPSAETQWRRASKPTAGSSTAPRQRLSLARGGEGRSGRGTSETGCHMSENRAEQTVSDGDGQRRGGGENQDVAVPETGQLRRAVLSMGGFSSEFWRDYTGLWVVCCFLEKVKNH